MNKPTSHPLSNTIRLLLMAVLAIVLTLGSGQTVHAFASPAPVDLGTAANFVILTKTGITNVPVSAITGNLGTSPIDSTAITGFSLVADSTNTFSTSSQVTGKIYAADYADPTPANLTTAVSNMETAYADAAGRALPDAIELYAGDLSGQTLAPGLYKWSSGVLITSNVTLAGPANAVWIFQIAGDLTMGSGAQVLLSGGAQAGNIFWQVGGGTGVEIGTGAHVEGNILATKAINLRTGASLNGRALAQTAVTLDQNTVVIPSSSGPSTAPTVSSIACSKSPTRAATMNFTVVFSESVKGVNATDFSLHTTGVNGASVGTVIGSGAIRTVSVDTGSGSGTIRLDVKSSGTGITNTADVPLSGGFTNGLTCTVDKTRPAVLSIMRANANPTNLPNVYYSVTFSEPVTGVNAGDFTLHTTGVHGASITTVSGSGTTRKVLVDTGSGSGTIRLDVKSSGTGITDAVNNPLNGGFTSGQTYRVIKIQTLIVKSIGTQDGWTLESGQNTNVGGRQNSVSTLIRLGDDTAKKQYRGILSFNTGSGLPDNAVVTKVTLKVRNQGVIGGGNPVAAFQGFMVDIRKGTFAAAALQIGDFQSTANQSYGPFSPGLTDNWYSINLINGKTYINKLGTDGGLTQIRLRLKLGDNNNSVANYLNLFSGNAAATDQPQLVIEYYVP